MAKEQAKLHLLKEDTLVDYNGRKLKVRYVDQYSIYLIDDDGLKLTIKKELVGLLRMI
jgi:hypothetical protein